MMFSDATASGADLGGGLLRQLSLAEPLDLHPGASAYNSYNEISIEMQNSSARRRQKSPLLQYDASGVSPRRPPLSPAVKSWIRLGCSRTMAAVGYRTASQILRFL